MHSKVWDEPIHSQTSTVQPLKFGNGWVISSHTLQWMYSVSMLIVQLNHVGKCGSVEIISSVISFYPYRADFCEKTLLFPANLRHWYIVSCWNSLPRETRIFISYPDIMVAGALINYHGIDLVCQQYFAWARERLIVQNAPNYINFRWCALYRCL